jgi:hypothetical protein
MRGVGMGMGVIRFRNGMRGVRRSRLWMSGVEIGAGSSDDIYGTNNNNTMLEFRKGIKRTGDEANE